MSRHKMHGKADPEQTMPFDALMGSAAEDYLARGGAEAELAWFGHAARQAASDQAASDQAASDQAASEPHRPAGEGGAVRALVGALRYEWARLRTLRSTWGLFAVALVVHAGVAVTLGLDINAGNSDLTPDTVVRVLTGDVGLPPVSVVALVFGLVGLLASGQDHRHRLLSTSLCVTPRRGTLLAARAVAVGLFAAVAAVLAAGVSYGTARVVVGGAWTPELLQAADVPRALAGFAGLVALTAVFGVAVGTLVRWLPAAFVALLLLPVAAEPLAENFLDSNATGALADAARYLPFTAADRMLQVQDTTQHSYDPLDALQGGLLFLGLVLLLAGLAAAALRRRDA